MARTKSLTETGKDPFVFLFIFPKHLASVSSLYRNTSWGIYPEPPFIAGGQNSPPFPVVIQCHQSIANSVLDLMMTIVAEVFTADIEGNVNEVLLHCQQSDHFR
ncbi:hypothetical protein Moror_11901 [Moniliophthora roreri MCA 2997]|uniref:Uncharacterized protein n=2 Tax=Moniliophthora roreri TaxID=221103 RepID=V2WJV4_MONRO|nr:hypothetical protein Moror_11901 [Moniliophthora roreri MCA 2997]